MNAKHILWVIYLFSLPFLSVEASDLTLSKIQIFPIKDIQGDRQYELYIKLPKDYAENRDQHYPVIYYTDAIWHVELLSSATEYLMEDAILVGISWQKDIDESLQKERGKHVSRFRDYSINPSNNPEHQAKYKFGQAKQHLSFITNDIFSYVEKSYRTMPTNRSYFGYSLGGLFGAYVLMSQPDTFKNYILGSPALSGDIDKLSTLSSELSAKSKKLNANVFISYGSLEDELGKHAEAFITLLKNRNEVNLMLTQRVIDKSNHQTAFPMTGIFSVTWLLERITQENK